MINKSKKEKEFVSKCENLSSDGKGCVKFNNHVGFIANVLPGEEGSFVMTYYNSNQFYGYVMHGNDRYITRFGGAREIVMKMDMKDIRIFLRHYNDQR